MYVIGVVTVLGMHLTGLLRVLVGAREVQECWIFLTVYDYIVSNITWYM
jgi:hypothetical protein